MKALTISKFVLAAMIVALFGLEVYQIAEGVSRHGSFARYWDARERIGELKRAVDIIETYYVDESSVRPGELNERALESIMSGLDPYSSYLSTKDLSRLREETQQEFGGIGIQVEMKDQRLTVVAPIKGAPGARAGLIRGDQILQVDGQSIEGSSMEDSITRLRGIPGTEVNLSLYRPAKDERFDATLKREIIPVESVKGATLLEDGVGYLQILQFGARTGEEMRAAIRSLKAEGMTSLIIDLRGNPGGLLDAAVKVASPFLEPGQLVVYTEGRRKSQDDRWNAERGSDRFGFPLAILVNSESASAAEIVAGALKDWKRATLVGEKTFGKGSVQSILQVGENTGLRLTTARYYTPGGYVIHEKGIEPDITVETTTEEKGQLFVQRRRLEYLTREELSAELGAELIEDRTLEAAKEFLTGNSASI